MDAMRLEKPWLWLPLVLILDLWLAEAAAASMRTDGERSTKAQAHVDFRIVIPERLHMPTATLAADPKHSRRFISRTVERRPDRTVITVSMP